MTMLAKKSHRTRTCSLARCRRDNDLIHVRTHTNYTHTFDSCFSLHFTIGCTDKTPLTCSVRRIQQQSQLDHICTGVFVSIRARVCGFLCTNRRHVIITATRAITISSDPSHTHTHTYSHMMRRSSQCGAHIHTVTVRRTPSLCVRMCVCARYAGARRNNSSGVTPDNFSRVCVFLKANLRARTQTHR